MDIHLECVDPTANRFRAYHVAIEADLFAECALVVSWGRIGRRGRTRVVGSGDARTVQAMAERLLRRRERHGYVAVPEKPSSRVADQVDDGQVIER
jgi:predicted DNA-binding WGR domain protein